VISIDFDAVHRLATVGSLIEPLRRAFSSPASSPKRAHYDLAEHGESGTLLIMPAWRPAGAIGVKIATVFPGNADRGLPTVAGAYLLLSGDTGQACAAIDGRALTLLRTAAVSALAADSLAREDPEVLLMVGTGALSRYLIEGHLAVRKYESVVIWGRDIRKAEAVAKDLDSRGWPVGVNADLERAARTADVISCATMSDKALIRGAWLKSKSHLDLVGSFKPNMREADDECMRGAFIVVDTFDALTESGDLEGPLARSAVDRGHVSSLEDLIERKTPVPDTYNTVFKSVGVALADLAVAEQLFARNNKAP